MRLPTVATVNILYRNSPHFLINFIFFQVSKKERLVLNQGSDSRDLRSSVDSFSPIQSIYFMATNCCEV